MYTLSAKVHSMCVKIQCDKITVHTHRVYFYTQCILKHPSSDLLHCVFYTRRVYFYTQCVVLHTVCNYENFPMSTTVLYISIIPTEYFYDLQSVFGPINHDLRYFVAKFVLSLFTRFWV